MTTMSDRWARLPGWIRWPVGIVLTLMAIGVMNLVAQTIGGSEDGWATNLVLLILSGCLLGVGFLQVSRRLGGKEQFRMYRRAIRTGKVPEGADAQRWRPLVHRSARHLRGIRWIYLGWWILLGSGFALGLLVGLLRGNLDALSVGLALLTLLPIAAVALYLNRLFQRRVRQIERLERAIDDDSPEPN